MPLGLAYNFRTAMPAPRKMTRDIDSVLSAASFGLSEVHMAYQQGQLQAHHVDWVLDMRDGLGQMLAHYEDGCGFGMLNDDYRTRRTGEMRSYEEMANNIIKAIAAPAA